AIGVHRHTSRAIKPQGQSRYHPRWRHFSDSVVALIGDIDIARAIDRHAGRTIEPRGHRLHHALRRHFPDRVVAGLPYVDVARAFHRYAGGSPKPLGAPRPVRIGKSSAPGESGEGIRRISRLGTRWDSGHGKREERQRKACAISVLHSLIVWLIVHWVIH